MDDVACPVEDIETTDTFVQRSWAEGEENEGSGYNLMVFGGRVFYADGAGM